MLLDYFDNEQQSVNRQFLDDGYVSVIKCIYEVASRFFFVVERCISTTIIKYVK